MMHGLTTLGLVKCTESDDQHAWCTQVTQLVHGVLESHNSCMVYWSHMTIMHITLFRGYSQIYHNCRAATVN